eukprot:1001029-Prymnesium_polylepis.1
MAEAAIQQRIVIRGDGYEKYTEDGELMVYHDTRPRYGAPPAGHCWEKHLRDTVAAAGGTMSTIMEGVAHFPSEKKTHTLNMSINSTRSYDRRIQQYAGSRLRGVPCVPPAKQAAVARTSPLSVRRATKHRYRSCLSRMPLFAPRFSACAAVCRSRVCLRVLARSSTGASSSRTSPRTCQAACSGAWFPTPEHLWPRSLLDPRDIAIRPVRACLPAT